MQPKNFITQSLISSFTFAAVWTILHYLLRQELTYNGLIGGMVWFGTAMLMGFLKK